MKSYIYIQGNYGILNPKAAHIMNTQSIVPTSYMNIPPLMKMDFQFITSNLIIYSRCFKLDNNHVILYNYDLLVKFNLIKILKGETIRKGLNTSSNASTRKKIRLEHFFKCI